MRVGGRQKEETTEKGKKAEGESKRPGVNQGQKNKVFCSPLTVSPSSCWTGERKWRFPGRWQSWHSRCWWRLASVHFQTPGHRWNWARTATRTASLKMEQGTSKPSRRKLLQVREKISWIFLASVFKCMVPCPQQYLWRIDDGLKGFLPLTYAVSDDTANDKAVQVLSCLQKEVGQCNCDSKGKENRHKKRNDGLRDHHVNTKQFVHKHVGLY